MSSKESENTLSKTIIDLAEDGLEVVFNKDTMNVIRISLYELQPRSMRNVHTVRFVHVKELASNLGSADLMTYHLLQMKHEMHKMLGTK